MLTDLLGALATGQPRYKDAVGHDKLAAFYALSDKEKLKVLAADLAHVSRDDRAEIYWALRKTGLVPLFVPAPGPQTMALNSEADELLYGGAAGGGKSALLIGAAALNHKRALIVRRQSTELDGLTAEVTAMLGHDGFNKVDREHTAAGRSIKFGGMKDPDDWRGYAGRARDFMGFDEAAEFLEEQVASLLGWLRSTDPDQRCRMILASNPPRSAEGQWLIEWFAPWLDPSFPDIAKPGELRWYVRANSKTLWVDGPGQVDVEGETYTARSRTFVPALLDDNPFQNRTNYRAGLENLPEPLRSQLLKGDFLAGRQDDAWQVIPSDWIQRARLRWTERPPEGVPMSCVGVDVAHGGSDQTILAPRHSTWFAPLKVYEGIDTKDGPAVAGLVFATMRDGCAIAVDAIGWGSSAYDHLKSQDIEVYGVVASEGSNLRTKDGKVGFVNKRAELWWKFREALDPASGTYIALPHDPALTADLTAPRWKLTARGIQVELKEEIRKRLGRSPDRGDAAVMAWGYEPERQQRFGGAEIMQSTANVGYASAKKHYVGQASPAGSEQYPSSYRRAGARRR